MPTETPNPNATEHERKEKKKFNFFSENWGITVNQVRNLGSTKWDDHEMVKVILRSLVFRNPTQVQLICGDTRYKLMSPE
jgi:hypothetical protein